MKYIITDKGEVRTGGFFHADMAQNCEGNVVRAGHCEKQEDGSYKVWGRSIGYNIDAQEEDAKLLADNAQV